MKVLMKTGAVAAMLALPVAASAATTHDVTSPVTQRDIADGGTYGTILQFGDIASVNVNTETGDNDLTSALGFRYQPARATQEFALSLNYLETRRYGEIRAFLSDDNVLSADDVEATRRVDAGLSGDPEQDLFARSKFTDGDFFVLLDWTTEADNSFSYDVSVAAVPVPAAGFLLLGAVGGMAALRRRKKAA